MQLSLQCLVALSLALIVPARAQINTNPVYSAGQMSQQTYGNSQAWFNAAEMRRSYALEGGRPSRDDLQIARGARVIKAGRASIRFPMRVWPLGYWLKNTGADPNLPAAQERQIRIAGMQKQRGEWARQVKKHGAKWGDMGDMMAIATIIALETYTGREVGRAGFAAQSKLSRQAWLKDPFYQGNSAAQKQQFYESLLLRSTYPWYLKRVKSDEASAKTRAAEFLDEWYPVKTAGLVRIYEKYFA